MAEPGRSERRTARARLDHLKHADRDNHIIEDYLRDPTRAAHLEHELDLLERWHPWSIGVFRPSPM